MSEENESTFQPHSDEELARLLEEQMRAMRSATPVTPSLPAANFTAAPVNDAPVDALQVDELGIEDLFGALLEDTTDIPVIKVVEEESIQLPPIDENSLEHTQPITYIREEIVEVAVVDEQVIVEETVVEEMIEDAHVIAERILSEISVDGELFATTISETAGVDPVPQMFSDLLVSEPVPTPVPATPVFSALVTEEIGDETVVENDLSIFEETALEVVADGVIEDVLVEDVVEIVEAPQLRMNNPINSFAPRPTFDELVFGVKSDD